MLTPDRFSDEMRNLAIELQTLVQDKVGVSAFSSVWNSIARTKAMKRQARRNQRIIKVRPHAPCTLMRRCHTADIAFVFHRLRRPQPTRPPPLSVRRSATRPRRNRTSAETEASPTTSCASGHSKPAGRATPSVRRTTERRSLDLSGSDLDNAFHAKRQRLSASTRGPNRGQPQ